MSIQIDFVILYYLIYLNDAWDKIQFQLLIKLKMIIQQLFQQSFRLKLKKKYNKESSLKEQRSKKNFKKPGEVGFIWSLITINLLIKRGFSFGA